MKKRKSVPLVAWGALAVTILIALVAGGSPAVEGHYVTIRISEGAFQSTSYLGEDTDLVSIRLTLDTGETYTFEATGETELNLPEDSIIENIRVACTIDDNYAGTAATAKGRTRTEIIITDPDSSVQFADNFEGTDNVTSALHLPVVSPSYYYVSREYAASIPLAVGTWDLDAEYFIFALPV